MGEQRLAYLHSKVSALPEEPGVYQYFDESGKIIYIGKAKNLKKRVQSYFFKEQESVKTRILVRKIEDIRYIVVETETDALLLENNLIKKHKPRYNVLLKDDKSYPWICVKKEPFPRVFQIRNIVKDGSAYYGPYTSVRMVRTLLELIKQLFKLRSCKLSLTDENIAAQKFKVCLEYHIGNCLAPCIGKQSKSDYEITTQHIHKILKGNITSVINHLKEIMNGYAEQLQFEEAMQVKNKLDLLEQYKSKSTIVSSDINNVDVFSIVNDEKFAYVNFLKVMNGRIIQVYTLELVKRMAESKEDLLPLAIVEIRQRFFSTAKEIIVPFELDYSLKDSKFVVPQIGDKKSLLELSLRNVRAYQQDKQMQYLRLDPNRRKNQLLERAQKDLQMSVLPEHIECFDNSNTQGTNPVAACVVFKDGKPSKKDYRHFNIKTVVGPDDFASMEEIIQRRYKRMIEEQQPLPQLIIIDGGKGQLGAALNSLETLGLNGKIAIIGIAKRLEEIFFPGDSVPLYLDKNSPTLKLIQRLRDEAHRFGITHHRKKRSKAMLVSELDQIKGVGENTKKKLLTELKSVSEIKKQSLELLTTLVGESKAKIVYQFFHNHQ